MGVVNENSAQYANQVADPVVKSSPADFGRPVRYVFEATRAVQGDAGSLTTLVKLPAGRIRIVGAHIKCSALGTSRTMDLGFLAYNKPDGDAVAADPNGLLDGLDVASAVDTYKVLGDADSLGASIESRDGVVLTAQVNDGTHDAGETLVGWFDVMHIG